MIYQDIYEHTFHRIGGEMPTAAKIQKGGALRSRHEGVSIEHVVVTAIVKGVTQKLD